MLCAVFQIDVKDELQILLAVTYLLLLLICDIRNIVNHLLRRDFHIPVVQGRVFSDLLQSKSKAKE